MWPFEEELEIWFEDIEAKRKAKYGGADDDDSYSQGSEVPMMQNELVKERG